MGKFGSKAKLQGPLAGSSLPKLFLSFLPRHGPPAQAR